MNRWSALGITTVLGLSGHALVALSLAASACAELEQERLARIEVSGSHALGVGQTLQLVATTVDGRDAAYDYVSLSPEVATVTEQGLVRGVAPGEASIVVTGRDTRAGADYAIVVTLVALTDSGASGVPFFAEWQSSAHADGTAEAFTHWDAEGEVPAACARCHTSEGFRDFLGDDGSAPGRVDAPAPIGSSVDCQTCHNPAANALSDVSFPSGFELTGLGGEARCMTCHQGRSSGLAVQQAIDDAAVSGDDEVSPALGFLNIHYYPAASTLLAGRANGGYQYAERVYDTRFRHVEAFDTCTECHDPHSTRPRFNQCVTCHAGASDLNGAHDIRMPSSSGRDYDGDGDVSEGIYHELTGLRDELLLTVQRYGAERDAPLCYSEVTHPYWFIDTDADGACSSSEALSDNAYAAWTARLVKATYNYQMATKDPGAFAHNAKYILELLHDSIEDLNLGLVVKVDLSTTVRGDRGHFDGSSEAARHWDADEAVDATCSRCHGGQQGFRFFVEYGTSIEVPETANGLECGTCHTSYGDEFAVLEVPSTTFPSGVEVQQPGFDNLCGVCHSGRASKATLDAQIATGQFRFVNVHYLPAAGTKLGSAAAIGYEYEGSAYAGPLAHMGGAQCTSCHDPIASQHSFSIEDTWDARCNVCHADANGEPEAVRLVHLADYDGDADASESLRGEIDGMAGNLLAAMRNVAGASGLCYETTAYPYFFADPDGDGVCSADEATPASAFTAWTAELMRAAHNYQLSRKDPGAWAHNFEYIGQLLFDSTENLAASGGAMTRP